MQARRRGATPPMPSWWRTGPSPPRCGSGRWTRSSTRASSTCPCASSSGKSVAAASTSDLSRDSVDAAGGGGGVARAHHELRTSCRGLPDASELARDLPQLDLSDPTGHDLEPEDKIELARRARGGGPRGRPAHHELRGRRLLRPPRPLRLRDEPRVRRGVRDLVVLALRVAGGLGGRRACSGTAGTTSRASARGSTSPEEIGAHRRAAGASPAGGAAGEDVRRCPSSSTPRWRRASCGTSRAPCRARRSTGARPSSSASSASRSPPPAVTIVDDGTVPGALGSRPFDGEGLPVRRTVLVDKGVLSSYLLDTYSGRKLGMAVDASRRARRQRGQRVHDEPVPRPRARPIPRS